MPNSQPLPTQLRAGDAAITLSKQAVFTGPDQAYPLLWGLAKDAKVTVLGEPAIGAGQRWWRVRKHGDSGFAWMVECDQERYYLAPLISGSRPLTGADFDSRPQPGQLRHWQSPQL